MAEKMLTLMYPITQASLEEWAQKQILDADADDSCSSPGADILEALDMTIEQLKDVYLEEYQDSAVPVPEYATWFSIQALAYYGFGEYEVVKIDAYQDSKGNVYADIDDLC